MRAVRSAERRLVTAGLMVGAVALASSAYPATGSESSHAVDATTLARGSRWCGPVSWGWWWPPHDCPRQHTFRS